MSGRDVRDAPDPYANGAYAATARTVAAGGDLRAAAAALVETMTPEERLWCLDGDVPFWAGLTDLGGGGYHRRPFPAARVERVGFPGFAFADGPRGVVIGPATCFPVSMARGATWDPALEERIGDAIGRELRAVGADLYGGVCVNVLRHPAWGRAQETYGEDPLLVGEMGAALTRGVQRHAMACVKHYAANSMENARFKIDVAVDDLALHEVYLPHFRRIVDEGVAAVMSAYNSVNGQWCGQNRALLTDVLREEWGFSGFVISDFIFGLRDAGPSLVAGLDVEMPFRMVRAQGMVRDLDAGIAGWDHVDAAVTRLVITRLRFEEVLGRSATDASVLACAEHLALAREAAARSMVLLRNEAVEGTAVLPLDTTALRKVAVIGRLAALRNLGDRGSSDVWAPAVVTALDGLRAALPDVEVTHDDGADPERAAALAADADVAVVVVGYTSADEGEYIAEEGTAHLGHLVPGPDDPVTADRFRTALAADPGPDPPPEVAASGDLSFAAGGDRSSLRLHDEDEALVTAVAGANDRTVVGVVAGSAVVMPWATKVPAVLQVWYSGAEGGHALADVLLGRCEASGRLPFTVPVDEAHLPAFDRDATSVVYDMWHGWWLLERDDVEPAFPFGFGLSYTTFELGPVIAAVEDREVVVRCEVRNTGHRDGSDVVQVYGGFCEEDREVRPARRLVGFARVEVPAGGSVAAHIRIPAQRFAVRDSEAKLVLVRPGTYDLVVAHHAGDRGGERLRVDLRT
jgi:beta-glucosidase